MVVLLAAPAIVKWQNEEMPNVCYLYVVLSSERVTDERIDILMLVN